MHVDVIISTYDRLEQLKKCIKTILQSEHKDVSILVMVDGNKGMLDAVKALPVTTFFNPQRKEYVISMNILLKHSKIGAVLYGSDDLVFPPKCISNAMAALKKHFPDVDGLVGIRQQNRPHGSKSAFGLVGRKFVNRFPNNQMFCPDYVHYGSDTELADFARSINRFIFCKEAMVLHLDLRDKTDKLARTMFEKDGVTRRTRASKGLLWGREFK